VTIGFNAISALAAGKVDAATGFWNAEGVALRRRGVRTREFRVDDYGAPRYPELVIATKGSTLRHDPQRVRDALSHLRHGTVVALSKRQATIDGLVKASDADEGLVRAQLDAVAPALVPPLVLDRAALRGWARFDARFGILKRPPDVEKAFPPLG